MVKKKKKSQVNIFWDVDELPINFPNKVREVYEKIYIKNRKNYTTWIDKIGKKF